MSAALDARAQNAVAPVTTSAASPSSTPEGQQPYVDRLIDDGKLAPIISPDEEGNENSDGLPRYFRADAVASTSSENGPYRRESGLDLSGGIDTRNYGALSFNGVLRNAPNGYSISIVQRRMPFDDGWFANNSAGASYSPAIDLSREQHRFYVPTIPLQGLTTEWLHKRDLQLQLSVGRPGLFDGLHISDFRGVGGTVITGGAQWNPAPNWQAGFQFADASNVSAALQARRLSIADVNSDSINARSYYAGLAWFDGFDRVQANVIQSRSSGAANATGVWIDGQSNLGGVKNYYGVFRLDPELSWAYSPISNNVEGAYYRGSYHSQQWLVDAGVDGVRTISGTGLNGFLLTGNARYQFDHQFSAGAGATYRLSNSNAGTGYGFLEWLNRSGVSRVQVDASSQNDDQLSQLSLNQTWDLPVGSRLSTSISLGLEDKAGRRLNHAGASLAGGGDIIENLSWDGSLSYDGTGAKSWTSNVSANIGVSWRLNSHWSLAATYFDNRSQNPDPFGITPVIPTLLSAPTTRSDSLLISLRFQTEAGTPSAPIGGVGGVGAGSITGHLFLDQNDNGLRDANEAGVQNVTVLLDGRYATRTDAQGLFEFPLVSSGTHVIAILPDNLPLPWAVSDDGRREITISPRGTIDVDMPASRIR